ncbi:hypothetical protein CEXT_640281 [Caerostris extrusa]|uniref:Uncharacterized protein n=1 Tax=Caerostris extrusa TaxID=172846 RepID=A0AAV4QRL0_CAEEX|nr:hypothetical protein CEXT_640281 [Caerostris extrusa]
MLPKERLKFTTFINHFKLYNRLSRTTFLHKKQRQLKVCLNNSQIFEDASVGSISAGNIPPRLGIRKELGAFLHRADAAAINVKMNYG